MSEIEPVKDAKQELRGWGAGLILLGGAHFLFQKVLDPGWGVVLILLGLANLAIRRRGMFIVNGLALIAVGIMNMSGGGFGGWTVFGLMQIYWGISEMVKYGKYAPSAQATGQAQADEAESSVFASQPGTSV